MPPQFNSSQNNNIKKSWYKTKAGIIFIIIISIILFISIGFMMLIGYYTLKIKLGDEQDIISQIQKTGQKFSSLNIKTTDKILKTTDILNSIDNLTPGYGPESAPVTVLAFIDFECPFCRQSYSTFRSATKGNNNVRVLFKHFPLTSIHPKAGIAALAGECARDQNKFWEYYDLLFIKQDLNIKALKQYAADLNLDTDIFNNCVDSQKYLTRIEKDFNDGIKLGVRGTPTYIVNTQKVEGVIDKDEWRILLNK